MRDVDLMTLRGIARGTSQHMQFKGRVYVPVPIDLIERVVRDNEGDAVVTAMFCGGSQ